MWVSSVDDNKLGLSMVKDKCFGGVEVVGRCHEVVALGWG